MAGRKDRSGKVSTDGGGDLGQNPFAALGGLSNLPAGPTPTEPAPPPTASSKRGQPNKNRGRVEIRRLTGGRGGKTVTAASGFVGISEAEKAQLAKRLQKACGAGGTVKDGAIEIQGDKRDQVAAILTEAGFRPVMAGG
ncbi:translation initiation factor [Synoicihabitans lomoniglobus]|uniref:Translation initiation factor n=1 Tax=Synoicihabitans lomoniglobus TaxID=2909285 RepID=A0AAF0CPY6_9BACT|nr:translation initiation factor [Opitutaceae bacterium LMO-M01]WED65901.1 translation initiation factor [Opitutaceae bacterium LMO-M01]